MSVAAGPFPDRSTLFAVDRHTATPARCTRTPAAAAAHPAARVDPLFEFVPEPLCILNRKVDLIANAIDGKFDCLISRTVAVEIIDKRDRDIFSHEIPSDLLCVERP